MNDDEVGKKVPGIEEMLGEMAKMAFGHNRTECFLHNLCVQCNEPAINFDDEISEREYKISGMCQRCQNDFFCDQ